MKKYSKTTEKGDINVALRVVAAGAEDERLYDTTRITTSVHIRGTVNANAEAFCVWTDIAQVERNLKNVIAFAQLILFNTGADPFSAIMEGKVPHMVFPIRDALHLQNGTTTVGEVFRELKFHFSL